MEARTEGAKELILAVFRLAVADYLGRSYSYDGVVPIRAGPKRFRSDAEIFLLSAWAGYLAEMIGISSEAVWGEARLRLDTNQSTPAQGKAA